MGIILPGMKNILFVSIFIFGVLIAPCQAQESLRQMKSSTIERKDGKSFYIHQVKKGQTLYMISKAYEVEVNEIIQENPEVKEGLKAGQKLRIPFPASTETLKKQAKIVNTENQKIKSEDEELPPCGKDKSSMKKNYNIALMIPLYLSDVTQMEVTPDQGGTLQENRPLQFIGYYEGFRMALDSLEKNGVSVKVTIFDAERDTMKTLKLLQNPEMKNMDLIFGMMYHRNFQMVADFAEKNNIPIVNPMSEREQILDKNKKVFKVRPSQKTEISELIRYLTSNIKDSAIVVISDNLRTNKTTANNIMSALEKERFDVHLADGYGEVIGMLSKNKGNIIILISEDKSFVLDVITKLNEHRNEFGITLFGLPRWDRFDDIEADYLVNLKTHVIAPWFIDYDDSGVKKFVSMYQNRFQTDPDPLAFQGFDITYYFISALWKYGKSFERCLPELQIKSLQTDFRFSSSKENGYENQYWELYEYDNYHLKRIIY
jgi:ABC-type branched-subunit amino acid transport system substrate-binding protein